MDKRYYILIILLFWAGGLLAQGLKFTASVNRTTVATGDQFQVEFSLNGNGDNFNPPNFGDFQVLSGPNTSSNMTYMNGSTTVAISYSYILTPVKQGLLTIGAATINVNGRKYSTNPIKITAVKGQSVQQYVPAQMAPDNSVAAAPAEDLSKSLFIRAVVDKREPYLGEQAIVSFKLYTRIGIEDSRVDKIPDLNGFYSQDVKSLKQVQWKVETYKGLKYNVADIKQTVLFPEHEGNITIDPLVMTFLVKQPVRSNNIMDQFFGSFKEVKYQAKSAPCIVHVKALPAAGKPENFTGAIGKFSINAMVDKDELKTNESLNYKITVSGSGNLKLLKNLSVNFPPDFEKYDPKIQDTIVESATGEAGTRIYNYLLIPRRQGDYTIDAIRFSYFNPATNKYVTLATKSFKIKVNKGIAENNVTSFSADKQDVKQLAKDIRYNKTGTASLKKKGDEFFGSGLYYFLLLLGPVVCLGAYQYRNWAIRANSDTVKVKSKRAGRVAAKHLANAQKQLSANHTKEFYEELFKGLYGYLGDKLNIAAANLNRETIGAALTSRAVSEKVIQQLLETLDLCEMARYAPVTHIAKQEVFEKAKGVINDIEDEV